MQSKKAWQKFHPSNWIEASSPVTLGFLGLSLLALLLSLLTGGRSNRLLFSVYRSSLSDPLFYPRLFLHVLGHADFSHFAGNMALLLVLGPLAEKQYGSKRMLWMMALTALVIGLTQVLLSPHTATLGASGVVFMLILLAASAGRSSGKIPLTLVLVAVIYLGKELVDAVAARDGVSQLAHIMGGLCGLFFGLFNKEAK